MGTEPTALLQGTLDMLILKSLAAGELHGLGISRRIQQMTGGTFLVKPGSLFPALHRLEEQGFIAGEWSTSAEGRRIRAYALTTEGHRQLTRELDQWARVVLAVTQVLQAEE